MRRPLVYLSLLCLAAAGLGAYLWLVPVAEWDVPYVQTPRPVVNKMLDMADVGPGDVVYDLGSGDGRIAIAAVKDFNAFRAVGVEIDPRRLREARNNAANADVSERVEFVEQDIFKADFSEASVVTMYLLTGVNLKLRPRLLRELSPGTRIVSHDFDMGEWAPTAHTKVDGSDVYMWIVPARVAGVWQWRLDDTVFELDLDQRFQTASGRLLAAGVSLPITDSRLEGHNFTFTAALEKGGQDRQVHFEGRVIGSRMQGTLATGGESHHITAHRTDTAPIKATRLGGYGAMPAIPAPAHPR